MVAEVLVLHSWLASANRVEKICLVGRHIAVALRRCESFSFVSLEVERRRLWMFCCPVRQIFLAQPFRPTFGRICFRLRTYVLRRESQGLPNDFHCAFGAVESNRL